MGIDPKLNCKCDLSCDRNSQSQAPVTYHEMINTCEEQKQDTAAQDYIVNNKVLNSYPEPLKAINVGINNDEGSVDCLMSLERLTRVGCVGLNMHN